MFRAGNRVKVKDRVISKMSPNLVKMFSSDGVITHKEKTYSHVNFSNGAGFWFNNQALELIKNQQLLFDFMMQ
ncbi:hypothetical protein LCGC14_0404050 [marine sediment metagenome]|uniref:Uncharacterized protein n=1 Tax=marine sediment metagenome TaxID=412755 RepID=A0A0F9VHV3_9ZZZZ